LALAAAGCGKQLPPLQLPDGCNPLYGGSDCFMPYPSDFFRNGDHIEMKGAGRLQADTGSAKGSSADVTAVVKADAFSRLPQLVFSFPVAVSPDGFTRLADDPTTRGNTLVIDPDTGDFAPHFVDLDPRATDLTRQAIVVHVIAQLKESHRYVVAVHGVKGQDG